MGLQGDLTLKLDIGGFVATLGQDVTTARGDLGTIDVPLTPEQQQEAAGQAGGIDASGLAQAVAPLAQEIVSLIGRLPGTERILGPIEDILALVERFADPGLEAQLRGALDRLSGELETGEGTRIEAILRLVEAIQSSPDVERLGALFSDLQRLVAGSEISAGFDLEELVPAIRGTLQALGAVGRLETVLDDAEKLTGLMAAQLDVDAIAALERRLDAEDLAQFIGVLDASDTAAVEAAVRALAAYGQAARDLLNRLKDEMAFGEATLVYLELDALASLLDATRGALRGADLAPLERLLTGIGRRLADLIRIDVPAVPGGGLDGLLRALELHLDRLVTEIETLDLGPIAIPLAEGLAQVTAVPAELEGVLNRAADTLRQALQPVRDAVRAVPLDSVAQALRQVAATVADVLRSLGEVLAAVEAALDGAASTAVGTLQTLEQGLDRFKGDVDRVFGEAIDIVEEVDLEGRLAQVQEKVAAFSAQVGKADMQPYFFTAQEAIDATTGIIQKVPFSLLPNSMEQDVVDAIRPIKQADVQAVREEILAILGITPEGGFGFRGKIDAALADIQGKIEALIEAVRLDLDPQPQLAVLDQPLAELRAQIGSLTPQLDLAPLRNLLDAARAQVEALDPASLLAPVEAAMDDLVGALARFSPAQLIEPVDARIDAVRERAFEVTRLREWRTRLDDLEETAKELIGLLDTDLLGEDIERTLKEWQRIIREDPRLNALDGILAMIGGLFGDSASHIQPRAFERMAGWLKDGGGSTTLSARLTGMRRGIQSTANAVRASDPLAMAGRIEAQAASITSAIGNVADNGVRLRLQGALSIEVTVGELRALRAPHQEYLDGLDRAAATVAGITVGGFSEVDLTFARLRQAFAGLGAFAGPAAQIVERLGLQRLDQGLGPLIDELFEIVSPTRLRALIAPLAEAFRARLDNLIELLLQPLKEAVDSLIRAIELIDLTPLQDELDAIHGELVAEIEQLRPSSLLAEPLQAFGTARSDLLAFDPLAAIVETLEDLRDRATRIVGKLQPSVLLSGVIDLHASIVAQLEALEITSLLASLLDQLDAITEQISSGLERTVDSFERLQAALPDKVGSTSVGASVSVG